MAKLCSRTRVPRSQKAWESSLWVAFQPGRLLEAFNIPNPCIDPAVPHPALRLAECLRFEALMLSMKQS